MRPERVAGIASRADLAGFLARREGGRLRPWKAWGERRALRRCLAAAGPVETLCDCPCGPGRLFSLWAQAGLRVVGVDAGRVAARVARERLVPAGVLGQVIEGNAFSLPDLLDAPVDVVACVRFLYYADARERAELLRALASGSRRYVLAEYRSAEGFKARRNRRRGRGGAKHACSADEIRGELRAAGLEVLRFASPGPLSDRLFVLARKLPGDAPSHAPVHPARPQEHS